ncbi:MAG: recombinase family protein [Xanthobacteraceae bacterium]
MFTLPFIDLPPPLSWIVIDPALTSIEITGAISDSSQLGPANAGRKFTVMAWSVDRLGRSLQDLCAFLGELHATGRDLYLHTQGLDTTTPAGKAMFQMMGVFAEFERSMIG